MTFLLLVISISNGGCWGCDRDYAVVPGSPQAATRRCLEAVANREMNDRVECALYRIDPKERKVLRIKMPALEAPPEAPFVVPDAGAP